MPTTNPRITVTLNPRQHEVLTRLSAASGDSMSQIVSGFVELAIPSLERVVLVLERAKAAPQEVRAGLVAALDRADRVLMPALQAGLDQTDLFLSDLALQSGAAAPSMAAVRPSRGRGTAKPAGVSGKGSEAVSTPVPVTRGSGSPRAIPKARRGAGRKG